MRDRERTIESLQSPLLRKTYEKKNYLNKICETTEQYTYKY